MKIKHREILKAWRALDELYDRDIANTATARALYRLRKALEPAYEFHRDREKQIVKLAGGEVEGTQIKFATGKDGFAKYQEGVEELLEMEEDIAWERAVIPEGDVGTLSIKILDGLDGLIDFEEVK